MREMLREGATTDVLEGLVRDKISGNYRVEPGYGHQVHRYKIDETWLDEDDDLWIDGRAVEREKQKTGGSKQ